MRPNKKSSAAFLYRIAVLDLKWLTDGRHRLDSGIDVLHFAASPEPKDSG